MKHLILTCSVLPVCDRATVLCVFIFMSTHHPSIFIAKRTAGTGHVSSRHFAIGGCMYSALISFLCVKLVLKSEYDHWSLLTEQSVLASSNGQSRIIYIGSKGLPRSAKTSNDICKHALFSDKKCIGLSWLCCALGLVVDTALKSFDVGSQKLLLNSTCC